MIKKTLFTLLTVAAAMTVQAKTYLIDVRTPAELAQTGYVQGALHDDYKSSDFVQKFQSFHINPEDTIELYCRSGARAAAAKSVLERLGYRNVKNLGGYQDAASALNRPLVK